MKPVFKIKRRNLKELVFNESDYDILEEGTVLYVTHDNRPRQNVPFPERPGERWCWEYVIGKGGRLIHDADFKKPGVKYILSGSYYNFFVLNGGNKETSPDQRKAYYAKAEDKDKDFSGLENIGNSNGSRLYPEQWKHIKRSDYFAPYLITEKDNQVVYLKPKIRYNVFFGIRFKLQQFDITGKVQKLFLPMKKWEKSMSAENIHELGMEDSKVIGRGWLEPGDSDDYKHKNYLEYRDDYEKKEYENKKNIYFRDNSGYVEHMCDLMYNSLLHRKGYIVTLQKEKKDFFNNYLSNGISIQLRRNKTYKNRETGNFIPSKTELNSAEVPTEKLCMKVFIFVEIEAINRQNQPQKEIYQIQDDGGIKKVENFKKIAVDDYTVMNIRKNPLAVGLQQFYVLFAQDDKNREQFILKECYCDGDIIFKAS